MSRYIILAIISLFSYPVFSQDVLYLSGGAQLTITSGATMTIQGGVNAAIGSSILNNGNLILKDNSITGQSDWTDGNTSGVFDGGSIGSVSFEGAQDHTITGNTIFPSLAIDGSEGVTLANDISVSNSILLKNGELNTAEHQVIVESYAANAVQADASNTNYTNSWINGNLQRSITANTGTYDFPVGNNTRGNLLQFVNNNVTGSSTLTASFGDKSGTDAGLAVTENGTPYTSVSDGGVWYLNADAAVAGGNYALQLYFNGFTGLADNQFGILRRANGSSDAADWTVPAGSALESLNGDGRKVSDGYARRKNISTFSQLGIGMTAGVLPVTLLNFLATRENETSVRLAWKTASETNNKGFEIERRLGNETEFTYNGFEASKAAGGNSQSQLQYTYRDGNSFAGITYYRIKQVDLDNHYAYTGIKAVKGLSSTMVDISIMPNPNIGQFKILITGVTQSYRAFITDVNGKVMKQLTVQPKQDVNVQGLSPATYILTIKDVFGSGKNFSEKIIIVR